MKIFLLILGALFIVYGACLIVVSNLNFGVFAIAILGVLLLLYGIFYGKIIELTASGALKYVKYGVIGLIVLECCFMCSLAVYGEKDSVSYEEDALIVLGAGIKGDKITKTLKYRLDAAVEYSERNKDAIIVVSGGRGFQETVTEAYAMEKYLLGQGVAPERIVKEEKSASTEENMRFSKEILDSRLGDGYSVAVVTNAFHIYRGVSYAESAGFDAVAHLHGALSWHNALPCYLRETLAVLKLWLFE